MTSRAAPAGLDPIRRETARSVQVTVHRTRDNSFYLHVAILKAYNRRPAVVRAAWGEPVALGTGSFADALRLAAKWLLEVGDKYELDPPTQEGSASPGGP